MDLLSVFEGIPHVVNVLFHGASHDVVLLVEVSLPDLVDVRFFEHVNAVQALDALFEFLVVVQMVVQHFVNLVLELLLVVFLLANFGNSLGLFFLQTLSFEFHVLDNQSQVFIDDEEVF